MKCVVCDTVLGKWRIKYCTKTCYDWLKSKRQKAKYKKIFPPLPKILCIFCAAPFLPRDKRHQCCDIVCRKLLENRKDRDYRKEKSKPKSKPKKKGKIVICPLPIANSRYSGQIKEFEKDGGRIQVFAPQLNGRTPDVNITSVSGWSVETMFGYGYEIQLMEELNDAG